MTTTTDTSTQPPRPIDPMLFREVLGHYPTGVVVVTAIHPDGEHLALVVGTFSSVSLDPPLVSFLPMKASRTFTRLRECTSLCLNVLSGDQEILGRTIAGRHENKFDGIDWTPSPSGDPILPGSLAWLDARLDSVIEAGDHWIALCKVVDLAVLNPDVPLLFFQGGYGRFVVPSLVARMSALSNGSYRQAVDIASQVRDVIEHLAAKVQAECTLLAAVTEEEIAAVASASAGDAVGREGLGELIPAIPPLGDSLVCDAEQEAQARWLDRARDAEPGEVQIFKDRLSFCRENRYLLSYKPAGAGEAYDLLHDAAHSYAAGTLTPSREREVRGNIRRSKIDYALRDLVDGQRYDIGSIVAPIRVAGCTTPMSLRTAQLPAGAETATVREWVDAHHQAVREIEGRVNGA